MGPLRAELGWLARLLGAVRDADVIRETANQLLNECGATIRRLVAGLSMPDWPEGSRRAISFTLTSHVIPLAGAGARVDALLEHYRQTDGFTFDNDGD